MRRIIAVFAAGLVLAAASGQAMAGDNVGLLLRGIKKNDVERGQVLARLDEQSYRARLQEAEAQLEVARSQLLVQLHVPAG